MKEESVGIVVGVKPGDRKVLTGLLPSSRIPWSDQRSWQGVVRELVKDLVVSIIVRKQILVLQPFCVISESGAIEMDWYRTIDPGASVQQAASCFVDVRMG
jgi:hypothetical protein